MKHTLLPLLFCLGLLCGCAAQNPPATVPTVPASGVGTHTESILKNLGYSEEDIQKFTADGAVRTAK